MRRLLWLVLLTLAAAAPAQAANFQVTIAPRTWLAEWDTNNFQTLTPGLTRRVQSTPINDAQFAPQQLKLREVEADGVGLFGGQVNVSYGRFSLFAAFLTGDYELELSDTYQSTAFNEPLAEQISTITGTLDATRNDIDIALGYQITTGATVFAGYKILDYDFGGQTYQVDTSYFFRGIQVGDSIVSNPSNLSSSFSGPVVGFSGVADLGPRWFSFASVSALPFVVADFDLERPDGDDEGWGYTFDVGFGLKFPEVKLYPSLAYRLQQFGGFGDFQDTFQGLMFDLRFIFP